PAYQCYSCPSHIEKRLPYGYGTYGTVVHGHIGKIALDIQARIVLRRERHLLLGLRDPNQLWSSSVERQRPRGARFGCPLMAFANFRRRKKEVSGESAGLGLELFGKAVGHEGLAGRDSVDAAYLLNGLFQKILRAVRPESRQYVERSRYDMCLCKVRDSLELPQNRV